jgi:hypothetical protein
MKRNEFIKILGENGVAFFRSGSKHDIYRHIITGKKVFGRRHTIFSLDQFSETWYSISMQTAQAQKILKNFSETAALGTVLAHTHTHTHNIRT